ncbi:YebO family protein [Escherichia coli]|uniref:YebO family protein n=1 Tax=Escherichia coli TaxID=562 RepID=UPI000DA44D75|nr:YebO family protein [Escherichia coli]SQK13561.1 protein [Escherichia coli]
MNEVVNSGVMNIASLVVSVVVLLIGLILWFFINRASSRTNEQIELLEALLDQQKRQNALLRRLCEANEPEKADKKTVESQKSVEDEGNDSNLLIVFYVQIMPDDFVMQLHRF